MLYAAGAVAGRTLRRRRHLPYLLVLLHFNSSSRISHLPFLNCRIKKAEGRKPTSNKSLCLVFLEMPKQYEEAYSNGVSHDFHIPLLSICLREQEARRKTYAVSQPLLAN